MATIDLEALNVELGNPDRWKPNKDRLPSQKIGEATLVKSSSGSYLVSTRENGRPLIDIDFSVTQIADNDDDNKLGGYQVQIVKSNAKTGEVVTVIGTIERDAITNLYHTVQGPDRKVTRNADFSQEEFLSFANTTLGAYTSLFKDLKAEFSPDSSMKGVPVMGQVAGARTRGETVHAVTDGACSVLYHPSDPYAQPAVNRPVYYRGKEVGAVDLKKIGEFPVTHALGTADSNRGNGIVADLRREHPAFLATLPSGARKDLEALMRQGHSTLIIHEVEQADPSGLCKAVKVKDTATQLTPRRY